VLGVRPARSVFAAARGGFQSLGKGLIQVQVLVRDNNVDQALRALKKKMQREGIFREMKQRKSFEKPSERKNREKAEAIRRARKAARKQAQRDGLIAAPKPKPRPDRKPKFGAGAGAPSSAGGAAPTAGLPTTR
jgi:small subunit ribosomal protein S21